MLNAEILYLGGKLAIEKKELPEIEQRKIEQAGMIFKEIAMISGIVDVWLFCKHRFDLENTNACHVLTHVVSPRAE
jgi:hypothetical protein